MIVYAECELFDDRQRSDEGVIAALGEMERMVVASAQPYAINDVIYLAGHPLSIIQEVEMSDWTAAHPANKIFELVPGRRYWFYEVMTD